MKIYELFDNADCSDDLTRLAGLDTDGSVDARRIVSLTHEKLGLKKKTCFKRKRYFVLLAAAIIILSICTAVSAAGIFDFGFHGNVELQSENISVTAVPFDVTIGNINIVCDGMTGDNKNLYCAFTITEKDGRAFTDDISGLSVMSFGEDEHQQKIRISSSKNSKTYSVCHTGQLSYSIADRYTINAFLHLQESDLAGRKITVSEKSVFAYRFVKMLYQPEYDSLDNGTDYYSLQENEAEIERIKAAYAAKLKTNEVIRWDDKRCGVCVFERYEIPLDYEASFVPEYSSSIVFLLSEPVKLKLNGNDCTITELTTGGCSISLCAETESSKSTLSLMKDITVGLKNGSIVNAEFFSGGNPYNKLLSQNDTSLFEGEYLLCKRDEGFRFTPVDPDDIVSLSIDGVTFFRKEC